MTKIPAKVTLNSSTEWNLGFAYPEVVARLEKLFDERQIPYSRETSGSEARFTARLPHAQGCIELIARPAAPSGRSAVLQAVRHRTLLGIHFQAVEAEQEKAFMQRLTIAFLRVGG